jgi:hypothetical protein
MMDWPVLYYLGSIRSLFIFRPVHIVGHNTAFRVEPTRYAPSA